MTDGPTTDRAQRQQAIESGVTNADAAIDQLDRQAPGGEQVTEIAFGEAIGGRR